MDEKPKEIPEPPTVSVDNFGIVRVKWTCECLLYIFPPEPGLTARTYWRNVCQHHQWIYEKSQYEK